MPKPPILTFKRVTVPIRRPLGRAHRDEWRGVAYGRPSVAAPDGAEPIPLFVDVDGVEITDTASGVVYTVVPERSGRLIEARHYSETGIHGGLPEVFLHSLPRLYLAQIAQQFLDGDVDASWGKRGKHFEPERERLPRPDDERLVALVADMFAAYEAAYTAPTRKALSPRTQLAHRFGITPRTADEWIRYAREIAPDEIPSPATGRPRKPTERTEQ